MICFDIRPRPANHARLLSIFGCLLGFLTFCMSGCVKDVPYQINQTVLAPQLESKPAAPRTEPPFVSKPQVQTHSLVVAPVEVDKSGKLFQCENDVAGTNCQEQRAIDHIAKARAEVNMMPNQKLVVIAYIHGWHHNASWSSYNFRNFQRMIDCLNWGATGYSALYPQPIKESPTSVSCTHSVVDRDTRYVGVYVGWRGESMQPGLKAITATSLPDRHTAAIAIGDSDLGKTLEALSSASKGGNNPARFILIGHSFGGLIAGRLTAKDLLARFSNTDTSTASDCGGSTGTAHHSFADLIVLVNAADNSVRAADLIRVMKSDQKASPDYFCKTSGVEAPPIMRPIVLSIHTASDEATGEAGSVALALSHDDDNYQNRDLLDSIKFQDGVSDVNPGFALLKKEPINQLNALHNLCYSDQENNGDVLCDRLNDVLHRVKSKAFDDAHVDAPTEPSLGSADPFYHGAYELILSVCREANELASDSEYDSPSCSSNPELLGKRTALTEKIVQALSPYLAIPGIKPTDRMSLLLDLYKRQDLQCVQGEWKRSATGSLCSGVTDFSVDHDIRAREVWNDTPYWFANVSYEIVHKHSGFWNEDVFALITDTANRSPVLP